MPSVRRDLLNSPILSPSRRRFESPIPTCLILVCLICGIQIIYFCRKDFYYKYDFESHAFWKFDAEGRKNVTGGCVPEIKNLNLLYNLSHITWTELRANISIYGMEDGGKPSHSLNCESPSRVAIIIPFRDRFEHLRIFLRHLVPFMQRQIVSYQIFVVEQKSGQLFNRAALMNVGYTEARRLTEARTKDNLINPATIQSPQLNNKSSEIHRILDTPKPPEFTCFIFHDVDLLPLNDRIIYDCSKLGPKHMASGMDKFGHGMPYSTFFGGVCAFSPAQLDKINGFSNNFWGWGGEDDDAEARVSLSGQEVQRYPSELGKYAMIRHDRDAMNDDAKNRFELLSKTDETMSNDGLNSVKYEVLVREPRKMFYRLTVDLSAMINATK